MQPRAPGVVQGIAQAWREQPRQLFGLCFTEMWERFGFVTMTALKLLFLVSPVAASGMGWKESEAFIVLSWFAVAMFMTPLAGGWLSDNLLGPKRAILIGGVLMALGYLGLGLIPSVLGFWQFDDAALRSIIVAERLALGEFTPDPEALSRVSGRIAAGAGGQEAVAAFAVLYHAQTVLLVASMSLVIAGNALFKPSVSSLVGSLYPPGDPRRDGGFTLFWTCINVGSFLALVIGGGLGERLGWHYGFFAAAIGMVGGLTVFLRQQGALPDWVKPVPVPARSREPLSQGDGRRIAAILLMTGFAVIFNANHGQIFGLVALFVLQDVDRTIGTFELPALWITSLNPLLILVTAPLAASLWDILGKQGRNPSFASKFALALLLLAVGQTLLMTAAILADGPAKGAVAWVGIAIVFMSLAEIPLQPIGLAMVTQLTPPRLVSTMIGVWLLNYSFGALLGGSVAARSEELGLGRVFGMGALSCVLAALILIAMRGLLDRWMRPPERAPPRIGEAEPVR